MLRIYFMQCLHGDEQVIYGEKAYVDAQREQDAQAEGVEWHVLRKATRSSKLNCADRSFNRKSKPSPLKPIKTDKKSNR